MKLTELGKNLLYHTFPGSLVLQSIKHSKKYTSILGGFLRSSHLYSKYFPRRIHLFGIGTAKSGTESISKIFSNSYRAKHEPRSDNVIRKIIKYNSGYLNDSELKNYLLKRDQQLRLEVESSHLLVHFLPQLMSLFPNSLFINTVRHPKKWLSSIIDQNLNSSINPHMKKWNIMYHWWKYADLKYGPAEKEFFPKQEACLEKYHKCGVRSLNSFLDNWIWHNNFILDNVPKDKLLVIRTDDISESINLIADFCNIDRNTLSLSKSHSNKTTNKSYLLEKIDESYIDSIISKKCQKTIERIQDLIDRKL